MSRIRKTAESTLRGEFLAPVVTIHYLKSGNASSPPITKARSIEEGGSPLSFLNSLASRKYLTCKSFSFFTCNKDILLRFNLRSRHKLILSSKCKALRIMLHIIEQSQCFLLYYLLLCKTI